MQANFYVPNSNGSMHLNWLWIYLENMKVDFVSQLNTGNNEKLTTFKGHYVNPNKEFKELGVGADVSLNRKWSTGSNLTLILPNIQNISIDGTLKLPSKEFHEAKGKLFYTTPIDHVEFLAKYNTELSRKNYAVNGTAHITVSGCFFFIFFILLIFFHSLKEKTIVSKEISVLNGLRIKAWIILWNMRKLEKDTISFTNSLLRSIRTKRRWYSMEIIELQIFTIN